MQSLWQTTHPTLQRTQLCPLSQRAPQWSPVKLSQWLKKHWRPSTASARLTVCPASSFQCFLAVLTWFIGPRISTESLVVRTWCPPNEPLAIAHTIIPLLQNYNSSFCTNSSVYFCLYGSILKWTLFTASLQSYHCQDNRASYHTLTGQINLFPQLYFCMSLCDFSVFNRFFLAFLCSVYWHFNTDLCFLFDYICVLYIYKYQPPLIFMAKLWIKLIGIMH